MVGSQLFAALGRGLVAGAVGTAAMTVPERLQMAVPGREGSQVPGEGGAGLLPEKDQESATDVAQLNTTVHWAHGVTMGALRGALDVAGLRGPQASMAHFALLWGGDAALYRALGVADVPWHWASDQLATDLLHKGVYAAVTGVVYDALSAPS
jgi:hypothetical protein